MSSPEPASLSRASRLVARQGLRACAVLLLVTTAGCTVRPLYGDMTPVEGAVVSSTARTLASIAVQPVNDRVGQEVRNHLIFLLAGGAGQPASPAFSVELRTSSRVTSAAVVQVADDYEPTSSLVTVRASYILRDAKGVQVAAGTRTAQSAFDVPRQAFAALRAQRDAQNRGAREVAEQLRLAIAQDLERPSSSAAPVVVTSPEDVEGLEDQPEAQDNLLD